MKAIRVHEFGEPDVLQTEEVPDPEPGQGQVVVRVEAVGVNPVEAYVRTGKYTVLPELPYTPGKDAGGVIEAVGHGVSCFQPGDRVYTTSSVTGTYAEKTLCDQSSVYRLPHSVTTKQGACIGIPCGAAWRALFYRGRAEFDETVLVHGATGAAGLAAVQLARAARLNVIASGSTDAGRQAALAAGAHHALGHDDLDQIKALTDGRGVDLIIEMRADRNLAKDLTILATHGRVIIVGSKGTVEIDPRQTLLPEIDARGMSLFTMTPDEAAAMYAALTQALEEGALRPTIGREFALDMAADAHEAVAHGGTVGKVILTT